MRLWYWEIGLVTACSDFQQKSNTEGPNFIEIRRGWMHTELRGFWSCSSGWGSTLHGKYILQWKRLPAVFCLHVCWVQISEQWKIIQVWMEQPLLSSRRCTWMEEDLLRVGLDNLVSATIQHHQKLGVDQRPFCWRAWSGFKLEASALLLHLTGGFHGVGRVWLYPNSSLVSPDLYVGYCGDGSRKKAKHNHFNLSHLEISETHLFSKPLVSSPALASLDSVFL